MAVLCNAEHKLRREIRKTFRGGCRIYCRRGRGGVGFAGRIDLPGGSWCSADGPTRLEATQRTFDLAREPAPGFPGWVEPAGMLAAMHPPSHGDLIID